MRRQSALWLKNRLSKFGDLPAFITGDFNCTRDDAPYQTMMDPSGLILTDPAPKDPPGTFCSFRVNSIPCRAIDYIFYSKQWSHRNYGVISDNDSKYYPSDHLPVIVHLEIK